MRITVFAGSSDRAAPLHRTAATELGTAIAKAGHTLVYGGGRTGLMGAVADAALAEGGSVVGVILREFIEQDVHHLGLEELYTVDDMRSRKAGLDERADAFVTLPGGFGTFEEMTEILSFRKLGLHHRPLVLLNVDGFFDPFMAQIGNAIEAGFEKAKRRDYVHVAGNAEEALRFCDPR